MYKLGDFINTTQGFMSVQCAFKFVNNTNPRYDKLGGCTLYWLQDEQFQDVFLWDKELTKILIKDEEIENENDSIDF